LEFIQLCQSFDLTPKFAKVESSKAEKWKQSAKKYEQNVIAEELSEKKRLMREQKNEVSDIFAEIRENYSTLRYITILQAIAKSNNKVYFIFFLFLLFLLSSLLGSINHILQRKHIKYSIKLLIEYKP
jgi:hypothetical protein